MNTFQAAGGNPDSSLSSGNAIAGSRANAKPNNAKKNVIRPMEGMKNNSVGGGQSVGDNNSNPNVGPISPTDSMEMSILS